MPVAVIIPARYDSTRLPGKPLILLSGKPLIQHVYERARTATLCDEVIVATDNEEIHRTVLSFGGRSVMTSPEHPSGTDRIAEVARGADYDIIVNVQGDEPLIRGEMIDDVVNILDDKKADVGTLVRRIDKADDIFNPNVVKAVFDRDGYALYFSRAPIPFYRDEMKRIYVRDYSGEIESSGPHNLQISTADLRYYKHIGIYSYRRDVLLRLTETKRSFLEEAEKLEQLRFLENGYRIKVKETKYETLGVDTPEDLEKVKRWLSTYS